jgi:hypothetical protein
LLNAFYRNDRDGPVFDCYYGDIRPGSPSYNAKEITKESQLSRTLHIEG